MNKEAESELDNCFCKIFVRISEHVSICYISYLPYEVVVLVCNERNIAKRMGVSSWGNKYTWFTNDAAK